MDNGNSRIRYCECKGTENRVVDILSRYATVEKEEHVHENIEINIIAIKYEVPQELKQKLSNLGAEQDQDPSTVNSKDSLQQRHHPRYKMEENILYTLIDDRWKTVIPQLLVDEIIWVCHSCSAPVSYTHLDVYKRQLL